MIVIRKARNDEENKKILEMLNEYGVTNSISNGSISFVLEDNDEIKGGCSFYIINRKVILNFLIIDKNRRGENLGDGLLRAVLNYCSRNGVEKVYFTEDNGYLVKKGFSKVREINKDLASIMEENTNSILICDIEEFFRKGCCCKRS